jgi:hypothetical protein
MQFIDIKQVLEGEFHAKSLDEAMMAYVSIAKVQQDLNDAQANLFGDVLGFAQIVYARFAEAAKGQNESGSWWILAADQFKDEYSSALAGGKAVGATEKQLKLFSNACQTIWKAMFNGCAILERDKAGNFRYGSKGKLEQWNKKFEEDKKEREAKQAMEEAIAKNPKLAALRGGKADEPATAGTTPAEQSAIERIMAKLPPEVQQELLNIAEISLQISELPAMEHAGKTESGPEKAVRLLEAQSNYLTKTFAKDFTALRDAAGKPQDKQNAA